MTRLAAIALLVLWVGATVLLAELRRFRRLPLQERLQPFVPGGAGARAEVDLRQRWLSEVWGPLATVAGGHLARAFGVSEPLSARLARVRSTTSVTEFRTRQLGWAATGLAATGAALLLIPAPPAPVGAMALIVVPLLIFLLVEQQLARRSEEHQRLTFLELPMTAEHLGMLLSSGYSLTSALAQLAERGSGVTSADLALVSHRISQGAHVDRALGDWAATVDVAELHQLVGILTLQHDGGDIGSLIAQQARSTRRAAQRQLIEQINRRNEQVWIPVTIAALVPGVIFLAIPFTDALRNFAAL